MFGPDVTKKFLQKNKLDYIVRSHEVKQEGYEVIHDGKCITVFSAPNYWYVTINNTVLKILIHKLMCTTILFFNVFDVISSSEKDIPISIRNKTKV